MESKVRSYSCKHEFRVWQTVLELVEEINSMAGHNSRTLYNRLAPRSFGRWATIRPRKTVPTDLYTGLRKSRDKRTAALREKSGSMQADISATGRIIRRTALVFTFIRTATSMRAYGRGINVMARAHTGEMREASFAVNIPEIGSRTRNTVEVLSFTRTGTVMTATGSQECLKVKEEWSMPMKTSMRVNGTTARETDMAFLPRETVIILRVIGSMTWEKVKEVISITIKISFS